MATCDVCEAEEVAFIVGDANTGGQQFLGPGCMARFGLQFALAVLPPSEIADAVHAYADATSPKLPSEPPGAPRRPKRKGATEEPQPPEGPSSGPAEVPAAAEDA